MAKKKNSPLDDVLNIMGYDNTEEGVEVTDMDQLNNYPSNVDELTTKNKPDEDDTSSAEESGKDDPHEDTSEIPEDVLKNINNNSTSDNEEDSDEVVDDQLGDTTQVENPDEAQQIGAFFDAFAEALNWDVSDEDKPSSIEGLIDYIGEIVKQNSKPDYADDRIEQLDAYVRNGGKFEDFYNNQSQVQQYDTLDMEDETNQKAVVRDYMKLQGYNDE